MGSFKCSSFRGQRHDVGPETYFVELLGKKGDVLDKAAITYALSGFSELHTGESLPDSRDRSLRIKYSKHVRSLRVRSGVTGKAIYEEKLDALIFDSVVSTVERYGFVKGKLLASNSPKSNKSSSSRREILDKIETSLGDCKKFQSEPERGSVCKSLLGHIDLYEVHSK